LKDATSSAFEIESAGVHRPVAEMATVKSVSPMVRCSEPPR
jgi:hypothetical protein